MCYICGKSFNKIIHFPACGYVQQNSEKAAYYFDMAESFGDKYDDLSESIMDLLVSE